MNLSSFKILAVLSLFVVCISLTAQNKQYSFNKDKSELSLIVEKERTKLTVASIQDKKRGLPLREAKLYALDILTDTVGVWSVLPTKQNVWKLTFTVPEAKGFKIGFDDFYLPEGSLLYVYSKENLKNAVVYKHEDNPHGGAYSIENLKGDNVTLEYVAPEGVAKPRLHVADIGYKYLDEQNNPISGFDNASNSCMVNINCPEGSFWQNQKKGVLQLRVKKWNSTYLCSGTLINNTNEDKTPYVLTAYHCFENMSLEEISQAEFFFEYETPDCEVMNRPTYNYHKGAQALVLNPIEDGSDGALLKLSENIPDDWDVYYNGWDRGNDGKNITSGAIIHHPLGDVKKITLFNTPLTSDKWDKGNPDGSYWVTTYSLGATEGGSSGAPIFNQNGLVVGTLTGGDSDCATPTLLDFYGKFWYHFDQSPDADLYMSKYLDPNNTGDTRLKGLSALDDDKPDPNQQPDIIAYIENEMLNVSTKDVIKKIRIADLFGRNIYTYTAEYELQKHQIPVSAWRPGVYVLSVEMAGRSTKSVKIIK
ncbi:MAG: trypsin-like peptidase domain-containing protein [Dysgonomonas sp.]